MIIKYIKSLLPEYLKQNLKLIFESSTNVKWMHYASLNEKRIFVFLAGFYQNLGDLAITYAQVCFLKKIFPEASIICISSSETYSSVKTIKRFVRREDLITIAGGGNMDDEYSSLELARLFVIKNFPYNKIVSFPQTVHFSNTLAGRKLCNKSRKIYQSHKQLEIFVREQGSLDRINVFFPKVKATLCPDIVFSLDRREPSLERHGVLCCLRSDKERLIDTLDLDYLIKDIKNSFDDVSFTDTVEITLEECREERYEASLNNFLYAIKSSSAVLTDRLHGMIFCVITATPCVVLDNSNHKISEVYDTWLKDYHNIKLIRKYSHSEIINALISMNSMNSVYADSVSNEFDFTELKLACCKDINI